MAKCGKRGCAMGIPSSIPFNDKRKNNPTKMVKTDANLLGKSAKLVDKTGMNQMSLKPKNPLR